MNVPEIKNKKLSQVSLITLLFIFNSIMPSLAAVTSSSLAIESEPLLESDISDPCINENTLLNISAGDSNDAIVSTLSLWYKAFKSSGNQSAEGGITEYINDVNLNGVIDVDDSVWVYFNLGRGGNSLYAVDFTVMEQPHLMWEINSSTSGFSQLGQTWSKPKVVYSKFNIVNEKPKPVLIFAGGYDVNKDKSGLGTDDDKGNAIYMVDAQTGMLIWSLAEHGSTYFESVDSIPSSVAVLDSNGDGFIDRLYVGDTGGNIWRVDMATAFVEDVNVYKIANLGRHASNIDQRFFYEPTIVRSLLTQINTITSGASTEMTYHQESPFDVILIGSGNSSNPINFEDSSDAHDEKKIIQNSFYMIKDSNVITMPAKKQIPYTGDENSLGQVETIDKSDLYDLSQNPFTRLMNKDELESIQLQLGSKSGWFINYKKEGEKTTSPAIVINNRVLFTTSTPLTSQNAETCQSLSSNHWLYGIDLQYGYNRYQWHEQTSVDNDNRVISLGEGEYDSSKVIHINEGSEEESPSINIEVGNIVIDEKIPLETKTTYFYITENE